MRKLAVFVLLTIVLIQASGLPEPPFAKAEKGVLLVKLKNENYFEAIDKLGESEFLFEKTYRLSVFDKDRALRILRRIDGIEYAEQETTVRVSLTPADPLFVLDAAELSKQWYLPKMKVHQAWDISQGSESVAVAVIDTGVNGRHDDLNDGRIGRGLVNYCQVPSAVSGECLVRIQGEVSEGGNSDDNGHGTIVAGIIGAIPNNNRGIAGINWKVKIMPIKALDSSGSGFASDVAVGIRWAADNGARIINLSIGGPGLEGVAVLSDAIAYAFNKGVLVVAAAGNDAAITGGNLNTDPVLPVCADSGANMVVGVAAIDIFDRKARFSNYGSNCIDISAPGAGTFVDRQNKQGIVSTYFDPTRPGENNLYVYALGTSVAAPMVSGVAALMISAFPDLDVRAIRDRLIGSVDNIDEVNLTGCNGGSCIGQIGKGRLNALKAVQIVSTFSSGTLVRDAEGNIFLIEKGLKRPVSEFVFNQRFSGSLTIGTTSEQIASTSTGLPVPPADGTLVKEPAFPTVYLVEAGLMRPLSFLAFVSRKLSFDQVQVLSSQEISGYQLGSPAEVLDGALVKSANHPAVYVVRSGLRQLLSFFVFRQRGFEGQLIAALSEQELASYPLPPAGLLFPPLDGALIRGSLDPTVFLIEGGKRRALNLTAFQNRGFNFSQVNVLPQPEVAAYQSGTAIVE